MGSRPYASGQEELPEELAGVQDLPSPDPSNHEYPDAYEYSPKLARSSGVSNSPNEEDWLNWPDNNATDITAHLDLDIALDLEHELGILARLNRLGHFTKGIRLFEERLAPHVDFFPVAAEYADLLLEQGSFGQLRQFIASRLTDTLAKYTEEEVILLKAIRALAEMHTRGALIPALNMARAALGYYLIEDRDLTDTRPSIGIGIKIQMIEICLRIIAYVAAHSNFLETRAFQDLLNWSITDNGTILMRYGDDGLGTYILQACHKAIAPTWVPGIAFCSKKASSGMHIGGHYVFNGYFEEFAQLEDISQAGDSFFQLDEDQLDDEQFLLTEFANAYMLANFFNTECSVEAVQIAYKQFSRRSSFLASTISSEYPHLIKTRPYLNWMLLESVQVLPASCQLQMPVQEPRDVPEMRTWNNIDRLQFLQQSKPFITRRMEMSRHIRNPSLLDDLGILFESIKGLEDYQLERSVLEQIFRHSLDWDKCLQTVRRLSSLNSETMNDACGYLQCLLDEFFFLENNNAPDCEHLRKDLHSRLTEFGSSFPFLFDHDSAVRRKSDIVFFDNPLLKYMERTALCLLSIGIGRGIEAQLLNIQMSHIDHHLPSHVQSTLSPVGLGARRADDQDEMRKHASRDAEYPDISPPPIPISRPALDLAPRMSDAMKRYMRQLFWTDAILAPQIAQGNFTFTSLDGN
ncbi:uncharacterized protein AtWU_00683 [Aspergillus tubingensis]|uniref:Uncharacterized protein n=1 Tax=Aspergillus niger TaxID=5061 RepID=A0A100IKN5_ASPNG|nr:uncharacterized protein AtWU_00683 [Aspergillus tubingensis]GAQ43004.1 hypothetical protein ANI_1_1108124 [Aspergillus niger]GFN10887.1 predicted protein [Aspergillus tubingensis]